MKNNREITFRAWDKTAKKMCSPFGPWWISQSYDAGYLLDKTAFNGLDPFGEDAEDIVLMQYTGLKDKQGGLVYEDDILRCPAWVHDGTELNSNRDEKLVLSVVTFLAGAFVAVRQNTVWNDYVSGSFRKFEIIGNIYEHSHLLNQ